MAKDNKIQHGFTLVELLVVIAIILILAAALLFAINPAELLKKSRDTQRVSDLNTLVSGINLFISDGQTLPTTADQTWFSVVDATCTDTDYTAFTSAATKSCPATAAAAVKNDATGWVRANFTLISSGAPFAALPLDPTNTSPPDANKLYYRFCNDGNTSKFRLDAALESTSSDAKEDNDGGDDGDRYEVGNDLDICGT